MKIAHSKNLVRVITALSLLLVALLQGWQTKATTETMVMRRSHQQKNALHSNRLPASAATPLTAQTLTPAQIEAAVEKYFASVAALDAQRFANHFAPAGVLEDPVGTPPIEGQAAIAAFYAAGSAALSEIKPRVQEIIVGGNEAIVNWKLKVKTATGKQLTVAGMGLFKFNAAGQLLAVREFWDLAAFLAQLQS